MKNYSLLLALSLLLATGTARAARPDVVPTPGQKAMIDRKYGMFLHFGMNTYLNAEWSDGSAAASVYAPPADIAEKAAQWVRHALHRAHHQASRRFLPVGQQIHRL